MSAAERSVTLEVRENAWLATFQDLGREQSEALGVPCGGAADQHSASVANILVGNPRAATSVEMMGGRFAFDTSQPVLIAVTGTPADVTVNGNEVPMWEPVCIPANARVVIGNARHGMRNYLAFGGTLVTERFMGSASPEARMGFPQQISAGQRLELLTRYTGFEHPFLTQPLFRLPVPIPSFEQPVWTVDIVEGPETDAAPGIRELLASREYTVTAKSNHVGLRLDGPVVHPEGLGEIVSHGVPIGAFEIPHGDELIILGRYRTLTAGYPIVAFATKASLPMLGQARPGQRMAFRWVANDAAVESHHEAQRLLHALEERVQSLFGALDLPHGAIPVPAPAAA
ncbi:MULTISPECIES: biotin-dependent carboxyltransferase family protein [Arthrobacter]|uniref:Biotin-dependent carboxyltransferase n=1 Tax=Arthrobacter terricola TaxID=2547396 RepID=A0A4R5KQS0_9MICC|nr:MULTISPECIES: biotin-dependent carboxyltransferase family protein [Arthrobacter]MBT8160912.1 biotin-dependent carboxyltransferase family protein [Arthrobacter sp. GN70]TDF97338.1 biotin-dependent carboxyltransferase [Arthrobacter terricola]